MGDFTLYHKDKLAKTKLDQALGCLELQRSQHPVMVSHGPYIVHFYPKQLSPVENIIELEGGDFCGSSGTLIYEGKMGTDALSRLWHDFEVNQYRPDNFAGIFTVILKKNDRLYLLTDPMGGNRVYQNDQADFWSSSFLAAAHASNHLSPNKQAIYEYAFQETTYGADTVFNEVSSLDALKIFELTPDGLIPHSKNLDFEFQVESSLSHQKQEDIIDLLRQTVQPVTQIFGDKISTALSGGYDSRLMLALLQDSGSTPSVYVYGPDNSDDVIVAKTIAQGKDFPLTHINKANYPLPAPKDYSEIVRDNFYALDGLPGESIFDFGANMSTRRQRADNGQMIFNGGGGEIFRNFFYLPKGNFSITDLINSFYSRYTTTICQDNFQENRYRDGLHEKIKMALGATSDQLSRAQVEYAYPAFRLRYWTCRDNINNSRLGSYLTPFISYPLIRKALTLPLGVKNHGLFQAQLISKISPDLAAYQSDYGYSFDRPVPAKVRFKNQVTYHRPTALRRYSYAIQHKLRDLSLPKTLAPEYLAPIFADGTPHMSQYFKMDQVKDSALLARLYTLEYLFEYFGL